jgi:hypothetical protein
MLLRILLIVLGLSMAFGTVRKFRRTGFRQSALVLWILFWLGVAGAGAVPNASNYIANWVGVGRGVDFVFYVSILVLFFLLFRLFARLDKIERDITKIVRAFALQSKDDEKQ